jgi:mono/diheme cytochrome c family protein
MSAMRLVDPAVAVKLLADPDPKVRAAAIRCTEPLLASPRKQEVIPALLKLANDAQADVRLQFALTVSPLGTPEADAALARIAHDAETDLLRDAIISGLRGRELPFLEKLLSIPQWAGEREGGRAMMLATLSGCVVNEGNAQRVSRLLDLAAEQPAELSWRAIAILDGFPAPPKNARARRPRAIMLESEPAGLVALSSSSNEAVQSRLAHVTTLVHWPGQPGYVPPPPPRPLSAAEQLRFETGRRIYAQICAQCHKPDGMGQEGMAPPLVDSEWTLGPGSRLARIAIHGLSGPVTVNGRTYNLEMPALPTLSDDDIASVLTYVRREWGHTAGPVDPQSVAKARAETQGKTGAWTERELLRTP